MKVSKIELGKTVEIENWGLLLHQTVESKKWKLGKNVENRFLNPFKELLLKKLEKSNYLSYLT